METSPDVGEMRMILTQVVTRGINGRKLADLKDSCKIELG